MRNKAVVATAYRRAKGKKQAIRRHGITADMSAADQQALVFKLAEAKVADKGGKPEDYLDGQEWYVMDLVAFAGLSSQQMLDREYENAYPEHAEEDDLVAALDAI